MCLNPAGSRAQAVGPLERGQAAESAPATESASPGRERAAPLEPTPVRTALVQFTTGIEEREPIDQVSFVSNDLRQIFFYSDLRHMQGQVVAHRWLYEGVEVARVPFLVGGPRWRVWSSKELPEQSLGNWSVEIVAEDGEVVATESFTCVERASGAGR